MNAETEKQIKEVLTDNFDRIVNCFRNETLKQLVKENCFIAGGAVRNKLDLTKPGDIDLYFYSEDAAHQFRTLFNFLNAFEKQPAESYFPLIAETKNSHTFHLYNRRTPVQLVTKFAGTPEHVLGHFDFTNCMGAYLPQTNQLVITPQMNKALETKKLRFNTKAFSPASSFKRVKKFRELGYKISPLEYSKVFLTALFKSPIHLAQVIFEGTPISPKPVKKGY